MTGHRFRWDHHQGDVLSFALVFTVPLSVLIGYAGMIVLAMIPPLWRRVMDRRVLRALRMPNT